MALLRQCLQELRTKNHERHAPAGRWMLAKTEQRRRGPGSSGPMPCDTGHDAPAIVAQRLPGA